MASDDTILNMGDNTGSGDDGNTGGEGNPSVDIYATLGSVVPACKESGVITQGLDDTVAAIRSNSAQLCLIASDCEVGLSILVRDLCVNNSVKVLTVCDSKLLGQWVGEENENFVAIVDFGKITEDVEVVVTYLRKHSVLSLSGVPPSVTALNKLLKELALWIMYCLVSMGAVATTIGVTHYYFSNTTQRVVAYAISVGVAIIMLLGYAICKHHIMHRY